ncbi:hypothetical protein AVEN_176017-1 [Araneus ventricosus]|uniref:Uncharacterized protein n=1 Tax=Araneus ventricosus TaxID=182803 RepID=A0A4Y2SRQ7_ARAVE|nr:hypothetical protein AVEN_176017-1 [Araneus ventricosus]
MRQLRRANDVQPCCSSEIKPAGVFSPKLSRILSPKGAVSPSPAWLKKFEPTVIQNPMTIGRFFIIVIEKYLVSRHWLGGQHFISCCLRYRGSASRIISVAAILNVRTVNGPAALRKSSLPWARIQSRPFGHEGRDDVTVAISQSERPSGRVEVCLTASFLSGENGQNLFRSIKEKAASWLDLRPDVFSG